MGKVSNLIASSLRSSALAAYDNVAESQLAGVDLTALLFSNFDTVPAALLPIYAEFYGIARFVKTEAQTRALLGRIIQLRRKQGTPWSIRQALAALGYPDVTIIEGSQAGLILHDATINHDGQTQHGGGNWATFRVIIQLHGAPVPVGGDFVALEEVIDEFKPARCKLISLTFN